MPKLILRSVRREACLYVVLPTLVVSLIGIFATLLGVKAGNAVMLGAIIWLIPNITLAYKLFSDVSVRAAKKIVATFYVLEAIKLLLTVILFLATIIFFKMNIVYLLFGYMAAVVVFFLIPLVMKK